MARDLFFSLVIKIPNPKGKISSTLGRFPGWSPFPHLSSSRSSPAVGLRYASSPRRWSAAQRRRSRRQRKRRCVRRNGGANAGPTPFRVALGFFWGFKCGFFFRLSTRKDPFSRMFRGELGFKLGLVIGKSGAAPNPKKIWMKYHFPPQKLKCGRKWTRWIPVDFDSGGNFGALFLCFRLASF